MYPSVDRVNRRRWIRSSLKCAPQSSYDVILRLYDYDVMKGTV